MDARDPINRQKMSKLSKLFKTFQNHVFKIAWFPPIPLTRWLPLAPSSQAGVSSHTLSLRRVHDASDQSCWNEWGTLLCDFHYDLHPTIIIWRCSPNHWDIHILLTLTGSAPVLLLAMSFLQNPFCVCVLSTFFSPLMTFTCTPSFLLQPTIWFYVENLSTTISTSTIFCLVRFPHLLLNS